MLESDIKGREFVEAEGPLDLANPQMANNSHRREVPVWIVGSESDELEDGGSNVGDGDSSL